MGFLRQIGRRAGFTLMEVNLAIFIMATGVLAMVALYPLGYRENQQSREDVEAALAADALLNQIRGALSARTLTWNEWENIVQSASNATGNGWEDYCQENQGYVPKKKSEIKSRAQSVFNALMGRARGGTKQWIDNDYVCAIVARPGSIRLNNNVYEDWSRLSVSLRVARNSGTLFAQPIFFTEIHFQGDQKVQ